MEIAIIAGEVSGDIHAGILIREIKNILPAAKIWGICGQRMKEEGAEPVNDITELAVVGFVEVLKNYKRIRNVFYRIFEEIKRRRPKAVILVDYPGFNLRLAKKIKPLGIPIFYYISPQVWAWGSGRVKKIRELINKMIVIFPFEKEFYEKEGVPVEFVGHPLLDLISERHSNKDEFRKQFGLKYSEKLIGILPGSREQEVKRHLPVFLGAMGKIKDAKFIIGSASGNIQGLINKMLAERKVNIPVFIGQTYDIMEASDLILTSSGTATLETACFSTPMVVIYKLNFLTYLFLRRMVRVPFIAMANLIAGKRIVPELVQRQANAENVAKEAISVLSNIETVRGGLSQVKQKLGGKGAAKRAAEIICEAISD